MKLKTFAIGSALLLALFLFAQRRPTEPPQAPVAGVIDLTHSISEKAPNWEGTAKSPYEVKPIGNFARDGYFTRRISLPEHFATHVDAPAHFAQDAWTVDQIPVDRLVRPLVVIDVRKKVERSTDYQISMDDIATWEQANGQIPPGAVVMGLTGWSSRWFSMKDYRNPDPKGAMHFPGFTLEAVRFLVEGRQIVGLGIDTLSVDYGPSRDYPVHHYTAMHQVYHVENLANLEQAPETGATVVIAPAKLEGGSGGPVRVLALLK